MAKVVIVVNNLSGPSAAESSTGLRIREVGRDQCPSYLGFELLEKALKGQCRISRLSTQALGHLEYGGAKSGDRRAEVPACCPGP